MIFFLVIEKKIACVCVCDFFLHCRHERGVGGHGGLAAHCGDGWGDAGIPYPVEPMA